METAEPLPPAMVDLLAERFRLLAEPMRVRTLDLLRRRERASVGELASALGTSQQNLSKHLSILRAAGIVARRKEGNRALYSIDDPATIELCDHVCGSIGRRHTELGELIGGGSR